MTCRAVLLGFAVVLVLPGYEDSGSAVCAECHRAIFESYRGTPMASSSGIAEPGAVRFEHASFTHAQTGFRYRVSAKDGRLQMEFEKPGAGSSGSKVLAYRVGSGASARSYLLSDGGFLYEAPVAYYSAKMAWGLAPGYERYPYPYLTRPIVPACLACHASFLDAVPATLNRYGSPPFREGGVACERCHGPGAAHIARMQSGKRAGGAAIVNPVTLSADRRDSICAQCHLTGEVRVMRPGSDWRSFHPGDRLSDSQTIFVRAAASPGVTVTSHAEKLALSRCKQGAGDRLWCGSCHDAHRVPKASERAAWYRAKCAACHPPADCREAAEVRRVSQDDCTACHMPKSAAADAQHVVYTDHSIPRRPRPAVQPAVAGELVAFAGFRSTQRDLALAYAIAAPREGNTADRARALALLEKASREAPDDVEVLLYLAEIYRNDGRGGLAIPLYQRAIQLDPSQVTASVGLGGVLMERGQYAEAIRLWQDALAKNAGLELVRVNLAMAYWKTGDARAAESALHQALELNPAFAPAAQLLEQVKHAAPPR